MMKVSKILFCFCFVFIAVTSFAAEINISLDKKIITEGDTLFLTIEYSGDSSDAPDLSPLQKNFRIVSNSSSSQFTFINGSSSHLKKWVIGLQPLKSGKIVIPPVKLDNLVSNTVDVEVSEMTDVAYAPDVRENSNSPYFFIDQKFSDKNPYVQQQMFVFVNIYAGVGLQKASLSVDEQTSQDWVVLPVSDKPKIKQEVINGRQTNVATYVFAVFPQKSGKIKAPQFIFDGYYVKDSDFAFSDFNNDISIFGVDFHNIFGQRVPVKMKTKFVDIDVKPIPEGFSASNWLPLQNLNLSASWSVQKGFRVGDAFSRTINIEASGITESMLPQIVFPDIEGIKQYPEKTKTSEKIVRGQFVTSAEINNVYIPTKPGNLIVPEIKVKWFNLSTNKTETAIIPAETIPVLQGFGDNSSSYQDKEDKKSAEKSSVQKSKTEEDTLKNENLFNFYIFSVLIFLFFVFLIIFVFLRRKQPESVTDIARALKSHDYQKAKELLLLWAQKKYPLKKINNFNDIANLFQNDGFSECLSAFNKFLYSDKCENFDISKFIINLKKVDKLKTSKKKNSDILPNLYD